MGPALRAVVVAFAVALPVMAARRSATFHVGAVVRTSAKVSSHGAAPYLRAASNAPPPAIQVGGGPLQMVDVREIRLPESGTVVVTLQY